MKFIVKKEEIGSAVNMLSKIIAPKNALPILDNILCEVKNNLIKMTASDAEITLTTTINISDMEGEGNFCVPATWLKDALNQLSDQPLTITATTESNMRFTIIHGSGETFFPIVPDTDYPRPLEEKYNAEIEVAQIDMRNALKRSLWATANDEMRPAMNGIYFDNTEEYLDIVTSEGHVLVRNRLYDQKGNKTQFIMPKKVGNFLADVLEVCEEPVKMKTNERNCEIECDLFTLTFLFIEGKYPKYESIIPTDTTKHAKVSRTFMLNSVRKVIPFTDNGSKLLKMNFEKNILMLTGDNKSLETGANDKFSIEYEDEDFQIGVSGSHLLNVFNKIYGQECIVKMKEQDRAIVIEPVEQEDDYDVTMVVMPMLLTEENQ